MANSANPEPFEEKIRENHRQDPKFSFLNSSDPYHAYYRHRIERIRAGDTVTTENKETTAAALSSKSDAAVTDLAPKEPPPLQFTLEVPHKSAVDLCVNSCIVSLLFYPEHCNYF